jgi:hypothetical protein
MHDLKNAIKKLVQNTSLVNYQYWVVNIEDLKTLIAEYNIHFVEPEEEQLEL